MGQAAAVEALYNCNPPTKIDCDLFVMCGSSLMNGYSTSYLSDDAAMVAYLFPSGDLTYCERYGTPAGSYDTPLQNKGQFIYFNNAYNYQNASGRFSVDSIMAVELNSKYIWPRPYFFFHYEQNGASLIADESTPDWSVGGTVYPAMIENLTQAINILKSRGYSPRISVMWGSGAVTSETASDYTTSMQAIISGIRTAAEDNTIRFYWGKQDPTATPLPTAAFNSGLDAVMALDPLIESFNYVDLELAGDLLHPTTLSMLDLGFICAGYWYEKYYGNTRPTVSNVQINGTLKVGQAVTVSYTYTDANGDTENVTVVGDTMRHRDGSGTRIEFYNADDGVGTGRDYMSKTLNKGESYTLLVTTANKYLQVVVFPRANTGAQHGYPVKSAWVGAVAP